MDTTAESILTRDEMESRRLLAAQDLQRGLSQSQVARKFGVSRTTASRWHRTLSGRGVEFLRKRRAPGRPSRLTAEQLARAGYLERAHFDRVFLDRLVFDGYHLVVYRHTNEPAGMARPSSTLRVGSN